MPVGELPSPARLVHFHAEGSGASACASLRKLLSTLSQRPRMHFVVLLTSRRDESEVSPEAKQRDLEDALEGDPYLPRQRSFKDLVGQYLAYEEWDTFPLPNKTYVSGHRPATDGECTEPLDNPVSGESRRAEQPSFDRADLASQRLLRPPSNCRLAVLWEDDIM